MARWTLVALALSVVSWLGGGFIPREQEEPGVIERLSARIKALGMQEQTFSMVVTLKVKPESVKVMVEALAKAQKPSRAEVGCVRYVAHQDAETPTLFTVSETWRGLQALELHFTTEHFKALLTAIDPILKEAPDIRLLKEVPAEK